jgi:hypothetical protein
MFLKNTDKNKYNARVIIRIILEKLVGLFILFVAAKMLYSNIDLLNMVLVNILSESIIKAIGISFSMIILSILELVLFIIGLTILDSKWLDD